MSHSLREQLLKAGMVDKNKVKNVEAEKRKQDKRLRKNKIAADNEAALLARKTVEEKAARDRVLNQQIKTEVEKKAIVAQIRQLLESYSLPRPDQELEYHFTDEGKVKSLLISSVQQQQLAQGRVAIVKLDGRYELMSAIIAGKIRSRAPEHIVFFNAQQAGDAENGDDFYAEYKVPDDLVW